MIDLTWPPCAFSTTVLRSHRSRLRICGETRYEAEKRAEEAEGELEEQGSNSLQGKLGAIVYGMPKTCRKT